MKITNLQIYYLLILINNLWFITSNWLNFWLKFMSYKEVGVIDAVAFLIGILLEFPSGIISDKLGRKQTLIISQSFLFLGSLLITLASNKIELGLGFIIFQVGVAFFSGTIESFGYESSGKEGKVYSKVLVYSGVFTYFAYLSSLIIGGYFYTKNINLPNILFTINFLLGIVLVVFIKDSNVVSNQEITKLVLKNKFNLFIILGFWSLMIVSFSFDYGFLKLVILDKFSNLDTNYWYIFAGTLMSLGVSSFILPKIASYKKTVIYCLLSLVFSLFLSLYSFIPLFIVLSFLAVFVYQISLKYLNERVEDSQRASVISLFNMFYKLPYVLIALILGYNLG